MLGRVMINWNGVVYSIVLNFLLQPVTQRGSWQMVEVGVRKFSVECFPGASVVNSLHICIKMCILSCFSHVQLSVTLWTVACQTPLSVGFSRKEYWSGLPSPPPGDGTCISYISCIGRQVLYHWHHLGSPSLKGTRMFFWILKFPQSSGYCYPSEQKPLKYGTETDWKK